MDNDLPTAFAATAYRVRLARGGCATIRIGEPLPATLRALVGAQPWGFITAWNPHAQPRSRQRIRAAQRELLEALRMLPATVAIGPALGIGDNWREPSLFVSGLDTAALDTLARHHEQLAYVYGHASGMARLRWLDP